MSIIKSGLILAFIIFLCFIFIPYRKTMGSAMEQPVKARRFLVEKLVRDRSPERMEKRGGVNFATKVLEHKEYVLELKKKLIEEVAEVDQSTSDSEVLDELADVLEALYALANAHNFTPQQIEQKRLETLISRGGFENKIYLSWVQMNSDNPWISSFASRPNKYPEIEPVEKV